MGLQVKRLYDPPDPADGVRVLVDGMWPRGVSKQAARTKHHIEHWLPEVAPSRDLRNWFSHDAARWDEFVTRYAAELDQRPDALAKLRDLMQQGPLSILYAAKDREHNNAVALALYFRSTRPG